MHRSPVNEVKTFEAITRGWHNNTRRDLIIQFTDDWLFHGPARVKARPYWPRANGVFRRGALEDRVMSFDFRTRCVELRAVNIECCQWSSELEVSALIQRWAISDSLYSVFCKMEIYYF